MTQTELNFDRIERPHNSTATSIAAADSISPEKAATQRERILMFVKSQGGATRDEIEVGLNMAGNTVRPRVWELVRAGRLIESSEQRPTRAGCKAKVLKGAELCTTTT